MSDGGKQEPSSQESSPIDLSDLESLSFGPNWTESKPKVSGGGDGRDRKRASSRNPRPGAPRGERKDRRSDSGGAADKRPPRSGGAGKGGERRGGGRPGAGRQQQAPFKPVVDVQLYPEDGPFEAVAKAMHASHRTFELFEIAQLILQKPDRFVCVISPLPEAQKPGYDGSLPTKFYYSVPDYLPFENEEAVISHVIKHHLDKFFEIEEVEVEPPSGNFTMVNKCGMTGELLGPPNFHKYKQILREHHTTRLGNVPFEKFQSRIEPAREENAVNDWIESMKRVRRYKVKAETADASATTFETLESAKLYLTTKKRDEVVREGTTVRFSGRLIPQMPHGPLRRSVEAVVEHQTRFPLNTANNLRGRLRRMRFHVYKKGSKGVSYVCTVKRKFRSADTVFAEPVQKLIEYIEKAPKQSRAALVEQILGFKMLETEAAKPQQPATTEAAEVAPEAISVEDAPADSQTPEQPETTEEAPAEPISADISVEAPAPAPAPEAVAPGLSDEQASALKDLMQNLRWLISEGYVTEYANGQLFAPAPMPEPKAADEKPKADKEAKAAESGSAEESLKNESEPETQATPETEAAPEPTEPEQPKETPNS